MGVPKWMLMVITIFVVFKISMCQMLIVFFRGSIIWKGEINVFGILKQQHEEGKCLVISEI